VQNVKKGAAVLKTFRHLKGFDRQLSEDHLQLLLKQQLVFCCLITILNFKD